MSDYRWVESNRNRRFHFVILHKDLIWLSKLVRLHSDVMFRLTMDRGTHATQLHNPTRTHSNIAYMGCNGKATGGMPKHVHS
uniref:Uncharacterized protein n=1 Tax=Trichogramma kaykai TaxID=54128 RepID=A0ABD2XBW2_9HYME